MWGGEKVYKNIIVILFVWAGSAGGQLDGLEPVPKSERHNISKVEQPVNSGLGFGSYSRLDKSKL